MPQEAGDAVAKNALHLVTGQVILTVLSFFLSGALGRSLGPTDFGLYFFIISSTNFAYTIVDWGQSHVLIREIARRRHQTGVLLGSALALRCSGAVVVAGGSFLGLWLLGYDFTTRWYTALYIVIWIPSTVWMAYGMAFRAHERMDADAKVTVVNKALTLLFVLPALALGGRLFAVIVSIGAAGIGALAYTVALARRIRFPRPRFERHAIGELVATGAPLVSMNLLMMSQTYMEPLFLSMTAPTEVLGWYGAARTIANALVMPASIIASASFPRVARASGNPVELRREMATAMRPVVVLSGLVGAGTYAFAPAATAIVYGNEGFGGASTILQAIAPTLSLIFLNLVLATTVLVMGRAKSAAGLKVIALLLSAGLALWLVPLAQREYGNGALGLIIAFGVSEVFMLAAFLALMPKGILERRLLLDCARAMAAGIVALSCIRMLGTPASLPSIPLFLLAFGVTCVVTGLFSVREATTIIGTFLRRGRPTTETSGNGRG